MFLWVLALHFVADFPAQSHWMASNKATNLKALHTHVLLYAIIVTCGVALLYIAYPAQNPVFKNASALDWLGCSAAMFAWTYMTHFATDAVTSRISGKLFAGALRARDAEEKDSFGAHMHDFFVVIGFDQFIHAVTLYWTLKLLGFPV